MTSASGVATPDAAVARPVNLLMSGPVAGVVGGIFAGKQAATTTSSLDVGGTSADIGLAQEGRLRMKHLLDTRVGPYQAMIPMVDVDTIGAGGGRSPTSTGAASSGRPSLRRRRSGPAAYGRGGTEPTATDAMVNLAGLAGSVPGRRDAAPGGPRARRVRGGARGGARNVPVGGVDGGRPDPHALDGAVDRGELGAERADPRDFALVAEGGAGPLFAAQIALEVGLRG